MGSALCAVTSPVICAIEPTVATGTEQEWIDWYADEFTEGLEFAIEKLFHCFDELLTYIWSLIRSIWSDEPEAPSPGFDCWFLGLTVGGVLIFFVVALGYFGFDIFSDAMTLFGDVFGGAWGLFSELFSGDIWLGQYFQTFMGNASSLFRRLFETAFESIGTLAEVTYSNPRLWTVDFITACVYAFFTILTDLIGAKTEWEGTAFYTIYKIMNFPIEFLLDAIKKLVGSGILYWIARTLAVPFETGTFLMSFVVGSFYYLIAEFLKVLENKGN